MPDGLKVIKVELPYFKDIEVYPFADFHIGDAFTNEIIIKNAIDYILAEPNRFVILNGDLCNTALAQSVSDSYAEKYTPTEQIKHTANILKPLSKAGRILSMTGGNHEDRVYKATGLDMSAFLAQEMGILDRYADNSYILFVKFGRSIHADCENTKTKRNVYSFFCRHGSGGGKKMGGKANNVQSMQETVDADVYVMSHVHTPMIFSDSTFKCDYQNMTVSKRDRFFLISNAWQEVGGYGLKQGFTPASNKMSYVVLNGNGRKDIRGRLGI